MSSVLSQSGRGRPDLLRTLDIGFLANTRSATHHFSSSFERCVPTFGRSPAPDIGQVVPLLHEDHPNILPVWCASLLRPGPADQNVWICTHDACS